MGSACSSNVSGLHRGNSTTGVVNKSISNSDVDNPTSSSMSLLGSIDSWGIKRDNSSVKMGDHASWQGQEAEVSSPGSSNSGSVGGDHGSVGESDQGGGSGDSQAGSKNQELHVGDECVLR